MSSRIFFFYLSFFILLLNIFTTFVEASPEIVTKKPKICLVLKGGGALGLAHVGVLKVLEKNRVPVHCIAGASMGSIVGAAYASGNTIEDLEKVLSTTNWDELFGENIARETRAFRLKPGRNRELYGDAKLSFKDGKLQSPTGIIQGQNIRPMFQTIFGDLPTPVNFDSLPVPFRAITSDVETGEKYVPVSGDLATVVRASMSVPGAFSPVSIDGKLLVDGGIADNLPVDVALEMGADILIVIDLYSELAKGESLTSPLSVSGQMVNLLFLQNSRASRALVRPQDVLVEPNVAAYTALQFDKGLELIKIGEDAANQVLPAIQKLSISEEQYQKYSEARTAKKTFSKPLDFVRIKGESHMSPERLAKEFRLKEGDLFNREVMGEDIQNLYQTGYFQSVQYSLIQDGDKEGLEVDVKQKEWLDNFVRLGFALQDDFNGNDGFRLGFAYRMNTTLTKDGYHEVQAEIGIIPKISYELYQPIGDESAYFINPILGYGRSQIVLRDGGEQIAEYFRSETFGTLNLGRKLGTSGEAYVGATRSLGKLSRNVGDPVLPEFDYDVGDLASGITLDTLDRADFATSGYSFNPRYRQSMETLGASDDFSDVSGNLTLPYTFDRNTLTLRLDGANTFGNRPVERSYAIGGFGSVSGFAQNSLVASDYLMTQLIAFRRFSEVANPLFNLSFFLGGSVEVTNISNDSMKLKDEGLVTSGSVIAGGDTPIVPVYFGVGLADTGDKAVYFSVGRLGRSGRNN
jgi:NTE family protein